LLLVVRPDGEHLPTFVQLDLGLLAVLAVDEADAGTELGVAHLANGGAFELNDDVEVARLLTPVASRDALGARVGTVVHFGGEVEDLGAKLFHHLDRSANGCPDLERDVTHSERLGPVKYSREVVREVSGPADDV